MAEPKTRPTKVRVDKFIATVKPDSRRAECDIVVKMMKRATKENPVMWGPNIVGFGTYRYTYASGATGDWPRIGFSPRKTAMTLYIMPGAEKYAGLLEKLGKHKLGKSCLYLNKLADVDLKVLEQIVVRSVAEMKKLYP
jgi:hypothetical protein